MAGEQDRKVHLITREEIVRQLDALRFHGRRIFVWFPALVLINVPLPIYEVHLVRIHSPSRKVVAFGLLGLAVWAITVLIFVAAIKRTIARHAVACPLCSGRITWRERNTVLASGQCSRCGCELFRPN